MNTSFERLRAQLWIETKLGCNNVSNWGMYKDAFKQYVLTADDSVALRNELQLDAVDLYLKGLQSLCEAIHSARGQFFSWATVKAYYAVFYFLRASLALRDYAVLRNKSLYLLRVDAGEGPVKKDGNRFRGDHGATLTMYKDLYEGSDPLQSNSIDGQNAYQWLMERRNQVHYYERQFHDPDPPSFFAQVSTDIRGGLFEKRLREYIDDKGFIFCFQEDHAPLALPIQRALLTRKDFESSGASVVWPNLKAGILHGLVCTEGSCVRDKGCYFNSLANS